MNYLQNRNKLREQTCGYWGWGEDRGMNRLEVFD